MAMRTASPWWASLVFASGLLFLFVGERIFGFMPGTRTVLTGIGVALVVGVTGLRAYTTIASSGARRAVERSLLLCQLGVLLALVIYALTTNWGLAHFSFDEKGAEKFTTALTVIWTIVMVCSLLPIAMIEASLGISLRDTIDPGTPSDEGLEYLRVRDVGWSGLSVGLAMAFLMVTCNVANERNLQKDVSYFKTSSPGESTRAIVAAQTEPVKVLLFFPPTNEVEAQVRDYFEALSSASGHLQIEDHDRAVEAELAGKYKVGKDGMVVLVKGTGDKEKVQTIEIDPDIIKARAGTGSKLRNLDREVNGALLKVVRDKRKAYLTVGHGEINDPETIPPELKGKVPDRQITLFKKRLGELNYETKNLGEMELVKDVPDDATIVIVLAPTAPLAPEEWEAIGRYLDKGGRVMIALAPSGQAGMGALETKLGVKFNPAPLTDDQAFIPRRHTPADRRWAITNQFSAHASTTGLSRSSTSSGLLMIDSGTLDDVPVTPMPKKTITIRSMESAFLDFNDNLVFDAASEKRQRYNIAAAIEGPKLKDATGKDKDGWRALVFADGDLFDDLAVMGPGNHPMVVTPSGPLADDAIKWLGGEEVFAGEVVSEEDKPIQHTKGQDAVWFTLMIVGMPLLVLGLGLVGTLSKRRRSKPLAEVKKS